MGRKPNETGAAERSGSIAGMEDNLKKAVTEMLVLFLLNERDMYIGEIPLELERRSGGSFRIVFPYSIIYRMEKFAYIEECKKRTAPDGRRRQYYTITTAGQKYLTELRQLFAQFSMGIETILATEGESVHETEYSCETVHQADHAAADMQSVHETTEENGTGAASPELSGRLSGCLI